MRIMAALITKANSPKVIMVSGRPKRFRTGLTNKLSSPKTIANISAVPKPENSTPGKIFVSKNATTAVIKSRIMIFIIYYLICIVARGQNPFHYMKLRGYCGFAPIEIFEFIKYH